ncbi:heme anaerobic degradation radical SAM methyltransferase ChuW/HutW [Megasphaera vaginalis (ex Srinivasan et al. 2021)]|uniref:Putative heme utilization radical SAM enzyme HutW n=1 Tax=Megasphaera vaginalis (ex Srinivasan et al. 2021) TaxID=1111454 RepID=U7UAV8_9FIRM|nr:heme anaerobic degradation radical SAM methyltransferase ChuW/HutW [Megasphaera vaginalis (ex Srinivasan et al. 2021)]ERT56441.1 putative heme utilization radical SAM enzyme HutW [Megasphaera vaginalis (ex Srinivasan et al. 2021)]
MLLQELYDRQSPAERAFLFGCEGVDALTAAFPHKRVVHAGLEGTVVAPAEAQQIWKGLLAQPPQSQPTQSAYIHIPFCKTKCLYCGFFQNGENQQAENRYIDCLLEDIRRDAAQPRLRDSLIHSVFIGGGTPTSLSVPNVKRLLQAIRAYLPLANDYELTLEGRIHDLVPEKMEVWLANGVNRISLGVQSFHTAVRRNVGRLDDTETVLKRLAALKAYNQCVVVIDLIYGLPGQSMAVWQEDLRILSAYDIDGADLYQLNVFEDSDLQRRIADGTLPPAATTAEQAEMFAFARDYLKKRNYRRVNICHWSNTNRERSLYNSLTRQGVPMFPFGSGAGGNLDGYSTMLHRALEPYEMAVDQGEKPFMALLKQSAQQPLVNALLKQLEQRYIDLRQLVSYQERLKELKWLFDLWQERGLLRDNGVCYELTEAGEFWQVNIAQSTLECMEYLVTGKKQLQIQGVAAQDTGKQGRIDAKAEAIVKVMKEMKENGGSRMAAMQEMAEAMRSMTAEEMQAVMKRMRP